MAFQSPEFKDFSDFQINIFKYFNAVGRWKHFGSVLSMM